MQHSKEFQTVSQSIMIKKSNEAKPRGTFYFLDMEALLTVESKN